MNRAASYRWGSFSAAAGDPGAGVYRMPVALRPGSGGADAELKPLSLERRQGFRRRCVQHQP